MGRQATIAAYGAATAGPRLAAAQLLLASCGAMLWPHAALSTSAPALDAASQAVVVRNTKACHSPWQVMEGRECTMLSAGTAVSVISGDDFFACIVWSGTQRCMWVARDALRRP